MTRGLKGSKHPNVKIKESDAEEILRRYFVVGGKANTMLRIAKDYGLGEVTVWEIINRVRWKHVKHPLDGAGYGP